MKAVYERYTDNSISVKYLDDSELIIETKPHPVFGLTAPSLAKRTIQLPVDPLENKVEWRTRKETEHGTSSSYNSFLWCNPAVGNCRPFLLQYRLHPKLFYRSGNLDVAVTAIVNM